MNDMIESDPRAVATFRGLAMSCAAVLMSMAATAALLGGPAREVASGALTAPDLPLGDLRGASFDAEPTGSLPPVRILLDPCTGARK